jgi:hypothetical protein
MSFETKNPITAPPAGNGTPALPPTANPDLIEDYPPERVAEFLLNNATTVEDYALAVAEVRKLGIDPATVPHTPPGA